METKMIRVPFEVELAKKITDKSVEGRIVTRNGRNARIICFDAKSDDNIIALIEDKNGLEFPKSYVSDGRVFLTGECDADLMLEIPEYMTFRDGDVIAFGDKYTFIGVFKSIWLYNESHSDYVVLNHVDRLMFDGDAWTYKNARFATEAEKQKLIDALKASKEPKAKECLKKLGIEVKHKFEFKTFDKVLVRDGDKEKWKADLFSYKTENDVYSYMCLIDSYKQCIPYNEKTAHLLGTTENYE